MADTISNSPSTTSVRITVDPGKSDDEVTNNGVGAETKDGGIDLIEKIPNSDSSKTENEKNSAAEASRDSVSKLLLRPSALSAKPSFVVSPLPKLNYSSNKFACPDESADSLFSIPSTSEKSDVILSARTPKIPVAVSLSNPNYVFGQNIADRVTDRGDSASNGTGSMLFSTVAKTTENSSETKGEGPAKETSSLLEDAARCQEQRAAKRKYEEVQVTTGEEDEKNVLQVTVKLFAFEGGSWIERGRGNLRLNDIGNSDSRIVVRTIGNLRVALNTKIWPGMELSRASERSIRTTAMDASGTLKIFLIQANPTDVTTLYNHMEARLKRCQAAEKAEKRDEAQTDGKSDADDESPRPSKLAVVSSTA